MIIYNHDYIDIIQDIQDSCEPSIFSFERLLFNIINDTRSHLDILKQVEQDLCYNLYTCYKMNLKILKLMEQIISEHRVK